MEVGLFALGLGALGFHFSEDDNQENYSDVNNNNNQNSNNNQYSNYNIPQKSTILNTNNCSNGDNIYSQKQYDIVNQYGQNRMPGVSSNLYQKNNEFFNNTPGKDFTHNNMVPFFGGSIKQNTNDFITKTKLENFTGQFENNRAQKKEIENMFKPEKNVSNVNGMRNSTEERLERMNPSIYKQNEKPFRRNNSIQ